MAAISNYLRNQLLDLLLRGQAYTPPTAVYIALCSSAPTATVPGSELSGTGYGRVAVQCDLLHWSGTQGDGTTAASSGTSGSISNNQAIDFGIAGGAWGTASHWMMMDAATGGAMLYYGPIVNGSGVPTPRSISTGDPVAFPVSAMKIQMQ